MKRALAALAIIATVSGGAHAARYGWIVTSTAVLGYDRPYVFVLRGDPLVFAQLDPTQRHDLIASDVDPETLEPLFYSDGALGFGASRRVRGVERLETGDYPFFCSLHAWMNGLLQVRSTVPEGIPATATN